MKEILRIGLFLILGFICINIAVEISLRNQFYPPYFAGPEVFDALAKSRQRTEKKKIIIGDSIATQIFNQEFEKKSRYLHLASNQAIALVGQYIIAANTLESNPGTIDEIVLIYRYATFDNNLNQIFTFQYFNAAFLYFENHKHFTRSVFEALSVFPQYFISYFPIVKLVPYPIADYGALNDRAFPYIKVGNFSQITIDYLHKFKELAKKHNVKFTIIPGILSDRYKLDALLLEGRVSKQIKENGFEDIFDNYFDNIIYLPDEDFMDTVHLKKEILEGGRKTFMRRLIKNILPNENDEK